VLLKIVLFLRSLLRRFVQTELLLHFLHFEDNGLAHQLDHLAFRNLFTLIICTWLNRSQLLSNLLNDTLESYLEICLFLLQTLQIVLVIKRSQRLQSFSLRPLKHLQRTICLNQKHFDLILHDCPLGGTQVFPFFTLLLIVVSLSGFDILTPVFSRGFLLCLFSYLGHLQVQKTARFCLSRPLLQQILLCLLFLPGFQGFLLC